jgi:large subunit ribosomal protein L21
MTYAIIKVAGKQYRVREGERLLVDRLHEDEGATFVPTVLLVGGDGAPQLEPGDGAVTAKVLGDAKGPKIRIGKYKKRTGYRRHTGFRASLTQIQIESIGGGKPARASSKPKAESPPKAAGRLRGHDDRGHQGCVCGLGRACDRGRTCLRAGARETQGRHRRTRGSALAAGR